LNSLQASYVSMKVGDIIEYQFLVALYNQSLLEQAILRIINSPLSIKYAFIFCAPLSELDPNNFYLCYAFAKAGVELMQNRQLTLLERLETKRYFDAAFSLYPKLHDNINFIMDYIRFTAEYGKRKKVITTLLSLLEDDPHNDFILSAFTDEFFCICDNRIEVLFLQALSYHKEYYIYLLYADYLRNIVKDSDRAYLYYKISMDSIKGLQENIKKSDVLYRIAHLMETHFQDYAAAEDAYIRSIELDENNSYAHFLYASFLAHVKQNFPEARKHYNTALRLNPSEPKILRTFVIFLREMDKDPGYALCLENILLTPWSLSNELFNARKLQFFSQKL